MRIYLDNCSIQRPLDDRSQLRIAVESECVLGLLSLVEAGRLELVSSDALFLEVDRNPDVFRRGYALAVIGLARQHVRIDDKVGERAEVLVKYGLSPLDALHLACAEEARVDFFCTCDDAILRKVRESTDSTVRVLTPAELVEELER